MGSCASGASTWLCENIPSLVSVLPAKENRTSRQLIPRSTEPIKNVYAFTKKLGSGGQGVVHRVKHRRTEARRAVKTIPGSKVAQAREEISILGMMSHPSILKLHETFEEPEHIHLVTELCPGRDLHRQIEATRRFSEELTAALTRQLLDAVGYMHGLGVSHRDLKPENLMLMSKKDPKFNPQGALLKVVDFGLARTFRKGDTFRDPAGRGYFLAPEALSGRYDYRCDLWSCGVVLYYMLSGSHPWNGETEQGVRHEIESGHIDFESDTFWDEVPEAPKQLIGMLARVSAADRASPEQALAHDFIRRDPLASTSRSSN